MPSEPAAVDTDANGLLDTLYIGTTAGLLPIFDTGGREIFFRPTVVYDASSGHYALGFGTGDREDLWSEAQAGEEGRFYLILDPGLAISAGVAPPPMTEADFQQIPVASEAVTGNFLTAPVGDNQPGWVLQLGADERVVTDALAISGLLAFTTFDQSAPTCARSGAAATSTPCSPPTPTPSPGADPGLHRQEGLDRAVLSPTTRRVRVLVERARGHLDTLRINRTPWRTPGHGATSSNSFDTGRILWPTCIGLAFASRQESALRHRRAPAGGFRGSADRAVPPGRGDSLRWRPYGAGGVVGWWRDREASASPGVRSMRSIMRFRLALLIGLAVGLDLASSRPAAAVVPCTDGIVFGNPQKFYQALLGDYNFDGDSNDAAAGEDGTPSAYYDAMVTNGLPLNMQAMVNCGAGLAHTVPDIFLYRQRPANLGGLVRDKEGYIIARVYDYLDTVADPDRLYVAVVLTGCYTDNVFGKKSVDPTDEPYQLSVFWPPDHTHASNEGSDQMVGGFRCNDASGAAVYNYAPEGIELDLISMAVGSSTNDEPEAATWTTFVEKPKAPGFPAAMNFRHSTSAWWNMEMRMGLTDPQVAAAMLPLGVSYWNLEDNLNDGFEERVTDGDWKSPYVNPSNLFGQLGWGSTWFSDQYLWEWQHVYEFSLDVGACAGGPDDWFVQMSLNTHSSPNKPQNVLCGLETNQGRISVVKDSDPDDPWDKYDFFVSGPTPAGFTLQDTGANECPDNPLLCANPPAPPPDAPAGGPWTHPDRRTLSNLVSSQNLGGAPYRVEELNPEVGYTVGWECKNVLLPVTAGSVCDPSPSNAAFDFDACTAVPVPASCSSNPDWTADGILLCTVPDPANPPACAPGGQSRQTAAFELCTGAHVICRFTNKGGVESEQVCLETENAIGDLQVLGAVEPQQVSFTSAAVSAPGADSADSIFLASFAPIADQSRWPGTVDHFIQPLPVVADAQGHLRPDKSQTCVVAEDTACLAWDAAVEILDQAPDSTEVATDRRVGTAATERRVAYTKAAAGTGVPRSLRAFDYSDSDVLADEYDLWRGMGIPFVEGDSASEAGARAEARNVIRETLRKHTATFTDPDTGTARTVTYVAGDFFHGDPLQLGGPANFFYLANDLEGNGKACDDAVDPNPGYRCFFERQRRRRQVLLAPSNDGQLHAFDAGFFQGSVADQRLVGEFDSGTGKELFAHIPRTMLDHTRNMVTLEHSFGIDGALQADDVFIDPVHAGTATASEREWRSVVIGGYREGGRGLYALDLTQPDPVEARSVINFAGQADVEYVPVAASSSVPECSALNASLPGGCDQPYPAVLWEFEDECTLIDLDTGAPYTVPCDDDANGYPDLAFSWSKVNTGRVLVTPAGETTPVVRFVAVFGGGLDPGNPGLAGNFLYMVDVETGKVLYKRALSGAVPSEPAAVDTDANGILDTLYIGTTAGLLYKVDISSPGELDSSSGRVQPLTGGGSPQWTPFAIFSTEGRELFFRPTVIFEASSGHYALAFGTGDREDLWSPAAPGEEGRFYVILDPGFVEGVAPLQLGPLTEADFQQIPVASAASTANFLLAPVGDNQPGWVLQLGADERVVTDALAISGLLVFTTFDPERPDLCTFGGNGNVYGLLASNANAIGGAEAERAIPVEGFAGEPVVTSEGFSQQDGGGDTLDPFEAAQLQSIRQSLMGLFPADCRFGSFSLNVSTSLSSSSVMPLAQIPVCVARKNWTEN